jgi:hypothetical protein
VPPPLRRCARQLLEAGADANVKDLAGSTALARLSRAHMRLRVRCLHADATAAQMLAGKGNPQKKAEAEVLLAKYLAKK